MTDNLTTAVCIGSAVTAGTDQTVVIPLNAYGTQKAAYTFEQSGVMQVGVVVTSAIPRTSGVALLQGAALCDANLVDVGVSTAARSASCDSLGYHVDELNAYAGGAGDREHRGLIAMTVFAGDEATGLRLTFTGDFDGEVFLFAYPDDLAIVNELLALPASSLSPASVSGWYALSAETAPASAVDDCLATRLVGTATLPADTGSTDIALGASAIRHLRWCKGAGMPFQVIVRLDPSVENVSSHSITALGSATTLFINPDIPVPLYPWTEIVASGWSSICVIHRLGGTSGDDDFLGMDGVTYQPYASNDEIIEIGKPDAAVAGDIRVLLLSFDLRDIDVPDVVRSLTLSLETGASASADTINCFVRPGYLNESAIVSMGSGKDFVNTLVTDAYTDVPYVDTRPTDFGPDPDQKCAVTPHLLNDPAREVTTFFRVTGYETRVEYWQPVRYDYKYFGTEVLTLDELFELDISVTGFNYLSYQVTCLLDNGYYAEWTSWFGTGVGAQLVPSLLGVSNITNADGIVSVEFDTLNLNMTTYNLGPNNIDQNGVSHAEYIGVIWGTLEQQTWNNYTDSYDFSDTVDPGTYTLAVNVRAYGTSGSTIIYPLFQAVWPVLHIQAAAPEEDPELVELLVEAVFPPGPFPPAPPPPPPPPWIVTPPTPPEPPTPPTSPPPGFTSAEASYQVPVCNFRYRGHKERIKWNIASEAVVTGLQDIDQRITSSDQLLECVADACYSSGTTMNKSVDALVTHIAAQLQILRIRERGL